MAEPHSEGSLGLWLTMKEWQPGNQERQRRMIMWAKLWTVQSQWEMQQLQVLLSPIHWNTSHWMQISKLENQSKGEMYKAKI